MPRAGLPSVERLGKPAGKLHLRLLDRRPRQRIDQRLRATLGTQRKLTAAGKLKAMPGGRKLVLRWGGGGKFHFAQFVNHPGYKGDPWLTRAAAQAPLIFEAQLAALIASNAASNAATEVGQLGTFPAEWVARLTVLRAYVIACTESMKSPDDMFVAKLAAYRKEFDAALLQARAAQQAIDALSANRSSGGGFFTIGIERG